MVLCAAGRKLEGLLQRHCWQGSADVMSALCVMCLFRAWHSSRACSRGTARASCSSKFVPYPSGLKKSKSLHWSLHDGILVVDCCCGKLRVKRRHPPPAARLRSHHGQSPFRSGRALPC